MSNKEKLYRSISLLSAFFMLIVSFTLIALLTMDIIGLNTFESDKARDYWVQFTSEERMLAEYHYVRGQKIDIPADPKHSEDEYFKYTFRGWDITGDNNPDIVPAHAFYDFLAVAVYQKIQIKPLPKSSSEPEDSSSDSSSNSSSRRTANVAYIVEGVTTYGA